MDTWLIITIIAIALLSIGLYLRARSVTPGATRSTGPARLLPTQWEKKVMTQMRGDQARFQRTLDAKRVKHPRASREQLLEMIHDEYVRDNR